ncbi:hypothetical protein AgCh_018243 [Apium graveolens]
MKKKMKTVMKLYVLAIKYKSVIVVRLRRVVAAKLMDHYNSRRIDGEKFDTSRHMDERDRSLQNVNNGSSQEISINNLSSNVLQLNKHNIHVFLIILLKQDKSVLTGSQDLRISVLILSGDNHQKMDIRT